MNLKKNIYPCLIYVFTIIILFSTVVIPENAYAQNGVYDWLNAETHSPEYDFSNKNLAFYAKDDNLSLNNKGFLVFDGNTLSVKKIILLRLAAQIIWEIITDCPEARFLLIH